MQTTLRPSEGFHLGPREPRRPLSMTVPEHYLDIVRFIHRYQDEQGWAPTFREIQHECSISSLSMVSYRMERLQRAGFLIYVPGQARCIRLLVKGLVA